METYSLLKTDYILAGSEEDVRSEICFTVANFFGFELKRRNQLGNETYSELIPPILVEEGAPFLHSGLCICARLLLMSSNDHTLTSLLGAKSNLLKSYESLCDWRFVFEVQFPKLIAELAANGGVLSNCNLLIKIDQDLKIPAAVFNGPGLAKKLEKQCKNINDNISDPKVFSNHNISKWFLCSRKFQSIVQSGFIPNIYCTGLTPTIIDILLFTYIAKLTQTSTDVSFENIPEIRRLTILMLLAFEDLLDRTTINTSLLKKKLRYDINLLSYDFFIPDTDVGYVKNPPQINQGRWLPRGLSKQDLIGMVMKAVENPSTDVHPNSDWMAHFNWSSLPEFADVSHFVPEKRTDRKREQILSIVSACLKISRPGFVIVDFCSGGGHVGLLLAHLLPDCQIILLDNKLESLEEAKKRIQMGGLGNIKMLHCSIEQFKGRFDVGVSLHACGPSTDIVLSMCYKQKASFAVCPCCYGNIRFAENFQYPRSGLFKRKDIKTEEFYLLTKGADNSTDVDQRNDCMNLVDFDRLQEAKELGYKYTVMTKLQPESCSPKNNLIMASYSE